MNKPTGSRVMLVDVVVIGILIGFAWLIQSKPKVECSDVVIPNHISIFTNGKLFSTEEWYVLIYTPNPWDWDTQLSWTGSDWVPDKFPDYRNSGILITQDTCELKTSWAKAGRPLPDGYGNEVTENPRQTKKIIQINTAQ